MSLKAVFDTKQSIKPMIMLVKTVGSKNIKLDTLLLSYNIFFIFYFILLKTFWRELPSKSLIFFLILSDIRFWIDNLKV